MVRHKWVQAKGGVIAYLESGRGKKLLVFLHGCFGTPALIYQLQKYLPDSKYRIIAPYLPGHGPSFNIPQGYGFEDLVSSMEGFLQAIHFERGVILGHSMGGGLATRLAKSAGPEKLILVDPLLGSIQKAFFPTAGDVAHDVLWDLTTSLPTTAIAKNSVRDLLKEARHVQRLWHMVKTARVSLKDWPVSVPTLVIWGRRDRVMPLGNYEAVLGKLPGAHLEINPGGHFWFNRNWQYQAKVVRAFIEDK